MTVGRDSKNFEFDNAIVVSIKPDVCMSECDSSGWMFDILMKTSWSWSWRCQMMYKA